MSLLIPSLLQVPAEVGGFTPKCYDFGSGTDLYLTNSPDVSGMAFTSSEFTMVAAFELPDEDFGSSQNYRILGLYKTSIWFYQYDSGTTARKVTVTLRDSGIAWEGKSTQALAKGQKYVIAVSYKDGVRHQLYINGVAETVTSETLNGGVVYTGPSLFLNSYYDLTGFTNIRLSHVWLDDTSVDLASVAFHIYMKMDDFVNDGTFSTTFIAPNGTPTNEDY
jgi:hypothetical protein